MSETQPEELSIYQDLKRLDAWTDGIEPFLDDFHCESFGEHWWLEWSNYLNTNYPNRHHKDPLDPAEWDFLGFIEDPDDYRKSAVDLLEGHAAREYELTRELLCSKEEYRVLIPEVLHRCLFEYDRLLLALTKSKEADPKRYLRKNHPLEYFSKEYHNLHPYIFNEEFPHVPWFKINELARDLWVKQYWDAKLQNVRSEYLKTIDMRWSDKDIQAYIKRCRVTVSSTIDTAEGMLAFKEGSEFFTPDPHEPQGGRGSSPFKEDLKKLGRYRILKEIGSSTRVLKEWQELGGVSPAPKRRSLNKNDLTSWHSDTLESLVSESLFLSRFIELK